MDQRILSICASVIVDRLRREGYIGKPLEVLARRAFELAHANDMGWLVGDDDTFRAGIVAVQAVLPPDSVDAQRVARTVQLLAALSSASTGVPVDWAALVDGAQEEIEPVPLQVWFTEARP